MFPTWKRLVALLFDLMKIVKLSPQESVTVKVSTIKVHEPQTVTGGRVKQDMIVADTTGRATVTLWGTDVGLLKQQNINWIDLEIRHYQGKPQLSFPSVASIDEISDVEDVVEPTTSDEESDEEKLLGITVSGLRNLETITHVKKTVHSVNSHIGECTACSTTQKLTNPKQTAKPILQSGTKMLTLRAYNQAPRAITDSQTEVSAQDLLYAPPFDCTYNKFNVITEICRKWVTEPTQVNKHIELQLIIFQNNNTFLYWSHRLILFQKICFVLIMQYAKPHYQNHPRYTTHHTLHGAPYFNT